MKFLGFAASALAVVEWFLLSRRHRLMPNPTTFKQRSGEVKGYQPPRKPTPAMNLEQRSPRSGGAV